MSLLVPLVTFGQEDSLPYHQIPDYPESYSGANVAARMIDGLGYRYYWATENLRSEDLQFKPDSTSRTSEEILDHIFGLSKVILNASKGKPNVRTPDADLSWAEKRQKTLDNFKNGQ